MYKDILDVGQIPKIENPLSISFYKEAFKKEEVSKMLFLGLGEYTLMKFPNINVSTTEKKIQNQNYNYFIHTMAEMIKKYMPDVIE